MLWAALFIFPGDRNPGMGYNDVGVKRSFAPQLMLTNCSAVKQLSQFYKHSKSADLLRKSLLSTLRFGRCKTNIHWMFCTSCLADPKFKSLIMQA